MEHRKMRFLETKTSGVCTTPTRGRGALGHQTKILRPILLPKTKRCPSYLSSGILRSTSCLCSDVMLTEQMFDLFAYGDNV